MIHQTFEPNIPVILHLPALTNTTADTDTTPTLFVIQEGIHCMSTTDYYFMNIQPEPTITSQADLQTAFHSIHLCSTKEDELSHGGEVSKEDEDTE